MNLLVIADGSRFSSGAVTQALRIIGTGQGCRCTLVVLVRTRGVMYSTPVMLEQDPALLAEEEAGAFLALEARRFPSSTPLRTETATGGFREVHRRLAGREHFDREFIGIQPRLVSRVMRRARQIGACNGSDEPW
jgi:hypothetical protein